MVLYADENFPLRVVEELRRLGVDVLTVLENGRANQSVTDQGILDRASELGRAILTLNRRDFKRLHLEVADHAGIIICTEDLIGWVKRKGSSRRFQVWKSCEGN